MAGFTGVLAEWIRQNYARPAWHELVILMPTARAAARLRARLSEDGPGLLPAIAALRGGHELAELAGIEVPATADGWATRGKIAEIVGEIAAESGDAAAITGNLRQWRDAEEIFALLNRFALYGIDRHMLRRTVPDALAGHWEAQAQMLLQVMEQVGRWLAGRGEVLEGTAEKRVLEALAGRIEPRRILLAGVIDGTPGAIALGRAVAERGRLIVPDFGPRTRAVADAWLALVGAADAVRLGGGAESDVRGVVAENDLDEARLVALAVREAVARGDKRIAVVAPERVLARRVAGELARWGLAARDSALCCVAETDAGRRVLEEIDGWRSTARRRPAEWRRDVQDAEMATLLDVLDVVPVRVDTQAFGAMVRSVLRGIAAPERGAGGVEILGALESRLLDFDCVVAGGAVEGVWPSAHFDAWLSEAHVRALGLPDHERRAALAGAEFEGLLNGGSARVLVSRSRTMGGGETVASRFVPPALPAWHDDAMLNAWLGALESRALPAAARELGVFVPQGAQWPARWSASMVEALLTCPYRALGERVLKLLPPDPLAPEPDARAGGLLVHDWLERVGRAFPEVTHSNADEVAVRMGELAQEVLRGHDAVTRAIWGPKLTKLTPALIAEWVAGARPVAQVETRMERRVGAVTVNARFDRVERAGDGLVVIDYKTTQPPTWSSVASGVKPQLAVEGWLLGDEPLVDLEFWHVRGYGSAPVSVRRLAEARTTMADVMAPVAEGLARLADTFRESAPFPAVPDRAGGGLLDTGHCAYCELAGVCRKQDAVGAGDA